MDEMNTKRLAALVGDDSLDQWWGGEKNDMGGSSVSTQHMLLKNEGANVFKNMKENEEEEGKKRFRKVPAMSAAIGGPLEGKKRNNNQPFSKKKKKRR